MPKQRAHVVTGLLVVSAEQEAQLTFYEEWDLRHVMVAKLSDGTAQLVYVFEREIDG